MCMPLRAIRLSIASHPPSIGVLPQQTAQAMHYGTLMPGLGEFAKVAKAFFAAGGKGMNVTRAV
jgi:hypothetical protein